MSDLWDQVSSTPEQTRLLGRLFGATAVPGCALLLSGELGAGKTCFSQGVAAGLEVPSEIPVTSPSYTLLNLYPGRLPLHHFDLYRLGDVSELEELGFDDYLYGDGVTLVEWIDRFPELELEGVGLRLEYGASESERRLSFSARGNLAARWLKEVRRRWETAG